MVRPTSQGEALWFYLPGQWILTKVSEAALKWELQGSNLSPNTGVPPFDPLKLNKLGLWRDSYCAMRGFKTSEFRFNIGSRVIRKLADRSVPGGHADGFYMSDTKFSGTDPVPKDAPKRIWSRDDGASYREFAKFFADCLSGGTSPLTWSEQIATNIRDILSSPYYFANPDKGKFESALPLLCSVMFISEPARNPRAWPIGLMMLDLVGSQYNVYQTHAKYYTWDRLLAHPERVDPGFVGKDPVDKPQKGPTGREHGKYGAPIGYAPLTKKNELSAVEGKYSASPSGSASTSQTIDVANDYIQMKELSLATRWLQRILTSVHANDSDLVFATWRDKDPLDGLTNLMSDSELATMAGSPVAQGYKIDLPMLKQFRMEVTTEVEKLLDKRCSSAAKMI